MKTMKSKLRAFYNQHYFIIASVIAAILVLGCTVYLYTSIGQRIAEFNAGFDGAFSLIWWGAMVFGMLCTPYLALWSWTTVFVPHEVAGCSIVLNLPRTLGGGYNCKHTERALLIACLLTVAAWLIRDTLKTIVIYLVLALMVLFFVIYVPLLIVAFRKSSRAEVDADPDQE